MPRLPMAVFLIVCVTCGLDLVRVYPQLPDHMATHFGLDGQADGWSSRQAFVLFYYSLTGGIALLFLGLAAALPKIPDSLLNLPNKGYWLAVERRESTWVFLRSRFLWMGSGILLFLMDVAHQIFLVALGTASGMQHLALGLALFLGFAIFWTVSLLLRFSLPR